ncbi:carbonic anhydrase 9-like [Copidosoma floridanum]|uniref:carbonic anhydrase 9-like n=1 Tax=Copidosoma floridanum TaxID=29053 RepID=UPI0006C9AD60|nr:carbonic anhydrase 9-like [Copidosoma floridanum]
MYSHVVFSIAIVALVSPCHGYMKLYKVTNLIEDNFPICRTGLRQSPIDLNNEAQILHTYYLPFEFENYDRLTSVSVIIGKDGHTVNSTSKWENEDLAVSASETIPRYKFLDLHLHWARSHEPGTEHAFYGRRYDAELHLVHINSAYKDFEEALQYEDGFLVLGALLKTIPKHRANHLISISASEDDYGVFNINFNKFNEISAVFSYSGSLTTPPCTENVLWVVPRHPFEVSPLTIKALRRLSKDSNSSNVRSLQKLNDREVYLFTI